MPRDVKHREFHSSMGGYEYRNPFTEKWRNVPNQDILLGAQYTESEGHRRIRKNLYDGGGPFYTTLVKREFPTFHYSGEAWDQSAVKADIGVPMPLSSIPGAYRLTDPTAFRDKDLSNLDDDGATAISLVSPTNPNATLGTGLAEMRREGIPSLPGVQSWKSRTNIIRAAGSEFLNTEFGWLPLVSEVTDVGNSVRHSRDILNQYERDSGRNVRREFTFPVEESEFETQFEGSPTAIIDGSTGWPSTIATLNLAPTTITQSVKVQTRKWFSGCFTYALPNQTDAWSGVQRNASEADKLFGINITPDVLWELTPWSWAIDWFSNTGDLVNNFTNFKLAGLVMRYGYMMEEKTVMIRHTFTPPSSDKEHGWYGQIPSSTMLLRSKVRSPANPFGFGVFQDSLSPIQIAIAAAVGISLL